MSCRSRFAGDPDRGQGRSSRNKEPQARLSRACFWTSSEVFKIPAENDD